MNHLATVQGMYAAFGRGDVPAILEKLAPDVVWEYGQPDAAVPWLQERQGREAAAGFFQVLAEHLRFLRFEPTRFLAEGDLVVVLVTVEATVLRTGTTFREEDEVHLWHFGPAGLVRRFAHRVDTRRQALAYGA